MPTDLGIPCGCDRDVTDVATNVPNVSADIRGWFRALQLIYVETTIVDMEAKRVERIFDCMGVIQPFVPSQLKLKPEGERSWKWNLLHTGPEVDLKPGEDFLIRGSRFRVMGKAPWSDYGTNIYELVEDYNG